MIREYISLPKRANYALLPAIPLAGLSLVDGITWLAPADLVFSVLFSIVLATSRKGTKISIAISLIAGVLISSSCLALLESIFGIARLLLITSFFRFPLYELLVTLIAAAKVLLGIQVFYARLVFIKVSIALLLANFVLVGAFLAIAIAKNGFTSSMYCVIAQLAFSAGAAIILILALKLVPSTTTAAA